jgi:hypothetical protein
MPFDHYQPLKKWEDCAQIMKILEMEKNKDEKSKVRPREEACSRVVGTISNQIHD